MQLGAECADNGNFFGAGQSLIDNPGRSAAVLVHLAAPYCALWDVEPLPRSFHDTVHSDVPTLVLAGSFDPVTPSDDSAATADALGRAAYVEFAGAGHGVSFEIGCATTVAVAFVADPEPGALDASRAEGVGPVFIV